MSDLNVFRSISFDQVRVFEAQDDEDEAHFVSSEIQRIVKSGQVSIWTSSTPAPKHFQTRSRVLTILCRGIFRLSRSGDTARSL
jgi:hypothetical protein